MVSPLFVDAGLHVLWLETSANAPRSTVRQEVRQALVVALSEILAVETVAIKLISQAGQPVRLAPPWQDIGLSLSHDNGRSLAAIHRHGPVGVDLLRNDLQLPDRDRLARDYLGPIQAAALAALPANQRDQAFAQAWAGLEASLKCLTLELDEWTAERAARLSACAVTALALPTGWCGAVATRGTVGMNTLAV